MPGHADCNEERKPKVDAFDLDRFLSQTTDVFVEYDLDLRYLSINSHAASLLNTTPEKVRGKTNRELIGPGADTIEPYVQRAFDSAEKVFVVHEIPTATGIRLYDTVYTPVLDEAGTVMKVVGICRDVTEDKLRMNQLEETVRIKTEELENQKEKLRKENQFISAVLDTAGAMVMVLDDSGNIVRFNRACEKVTAYVSGEAIGRMPWDLLAEPESVEGFKEACLKLKSGSYPFAYENQIITKDGERREIAWSNTVLFGTEKKIEYIIVTGIDITEHKRAEERLQASSSELAEMNEELKNFAYIVSHDLRAPLVSIKGFANELKLSLQNAVTILQPCISKLDEKDQNKLASLLREDIDEALGFIGASTTRMDDLINSILSLSRIGHRELKFEPIDMGGIVRNILTSLAHQIEQKKVKVRIADLPGIVADKVSVEQIMGNLLDNALKYLDPERDGEFEISAEQGAEEITFRVRDNGRGIAEEDMHKVFELFRRAGKQDTPGEGMGLAFVRALVRRHGGRIWCESKYGVGTTFSFSIPLSRK